MNTGGPEARLIDGRFELLQRLGGGGMGLVWRARDNALHREVALKEVRPPDPAMAAADPAGTRELRERVLREARSLARLQHPNVAVIHHIVDTPEHPHPWLVMELVSGGSLADRLARGPLTVPEAARIGRGVLAALTAAHAAGIQHRDVKPGNVLLRPDGTPVLTDFGIAAMSGSTALTATGSLIGSPEYIAPERIRGSEGDPSSDLWSLGMLLYVAVEGHHPLRRATTLATLAAVLDEPLPPPARAGQLGPVISALLAKEPGVRPDAQQLDRLLAAVEYADADRPVPGHAPGFGPGVGSGVAPGFGSGAASGVAQGLAPVDRVPGFPDTPRPGARTPDGVPFDLPPGAGVRGAPDAFLKQPVALPPRSRRSRTVLLTVSATAVAAVVLVAWVLRPGTVGAHGANGSAPGPSASQGATASTVPVVPVTAAPASSTAAAPASLLTPAGLRATVAAMRPLMHGSRVMELDVYPGYAIAQAPSAADPTLYDEITYRDGAVTHEPATGVDSSTAMVDLQSFNWAVLPGLLAKAERLLNVPVPTGMYIIVGPDMFDNTPTIRVYLSDAHGDGYLSADVKGTVKRTYPKGS